MPVCHPILYTVFRIWKDASPHASPHGNSARGCGGRRGNRRGHDRVEPSAQGLPGAARGRVGAGAQPRQLLGLRAAAARNPRKRRALHPLGTRGTAALAGAAGGSRLRALRRVRRADPGRRGPVGVGGRDPFDLRTAWGSAPAIRRRRGPSSISPVSLSRCLVRHLRARGRSAHGATGGGAGREAVRKRGWRNPSRARDHR